MEILDVEAVTSIERIADLVRAHEKDPFLLARISVDAEKEGRSNDSNWILEQFEARYVPTVEEDIIDGCKRSLTERFENARKYDEGLLEQCVVDLRPKESWEAVLNAFTFRATGRGASQEEISQFLEFKGEN